MYTRSVTLLEIKPLMSFKKDFSRQVIARLQKQLHVIAILVPILLTIVKI